MSRTSMANVWAALPFLLLLASAPVAAAEQTIYRLGWFDTPTPGNASFFDGTAEWTIAMQGMLDVPGDWPKFRPEQRVSHGPGNAGFGCVCITLRVDDGDVIAIVSARALSLSRCRAVKRLRQAEKMLR
jgi:hypothetical protein